MSYTRRGMGDSTCYDVSGATVDCSSASAVYQESSSPIVETPATAGSIYGANPLSSIIQILGGGPATTNAPSSTTGTFSNLPWYSWLAIGAAGLFVLGVVFPSRR
jgi:hypothetical protein